MLIPRRLADKEMMFFCCLNLFDWIKDIVKDIVLTKKSVILAALGLLSLCAVAVGTDASGESESSSLTNPHRANLGSGDHL
jgi:hypothetical protein